MTDIIFSFDTEDFTSCRAADGILAIANLLREEGIRGCFNLVGLLAEQLVNWGRTDVLDALKYHEVDFHSYGHTLHPCLNEYTDIEDFTAAYNEVMRQETKGLAMVRSSTGTGRIYGACPPGNNENYVAMYAYSDMGIPIYDGDLIDTPDGSGAFFCNMLYLHYFQSFEDFILEQNLDLDPAYIETLAKRKTAVLYNHPNRLLYWTFWDAVNYHSGINHHPFGEWEEAEPMTEEEHRMFMERIRAFIRKLKADGRFRFTTYQEVAEQRCDNQVRMLRPSDMPGIHAQLKEKFWPVNEPVSLSVSDVFAACVKFLGGAPLFSAGRVYGFLDAPYAITEPVTVSAKDVREAASKVDLGWFLPESFMVGEIKLGPADFLFAMLETLEGAETITLQPRAQDFDLTYFGHLADPVLNKWMFSPDFKAEILKKRTLLQAWTLRL